MAMPFPAFYAQYGRMEAIRAKEMVADHDVVAHGTNTAHGGEPKLRDALTKVEKTFIQTDKDKPRRNGVADPDWKKKLGRLAGVTNQKNQKKKTR